MGEEKQAGETLKQFAERFRRANFRFAIGNASQGFSSTWTAFGNRSDFYLGARAFMGSTKVSLHASGICRMALTERQYISLAEDGLSRPPDRALVKWRRPSTPDIGAVHVASIIFPSDYLRQKEEPRGSPKKPLLIVDAAPPGQAVEFGFFYSREGEASMESRYSQIGQPLVCISLESGEHVTIVARLANFDPASLPSQDQMDRANGNILAKDVLNVQAELPNLTGAFWNDPGDGGTLRLVEIGGMTLRRNPKP